MEEMFNSRCKEVSGAPRGSPLAFVFLSTLVELWSLRILYRLERLIPTVAEKKIKHNTSLLPCVPARRTA